MSYRPARLTEWMQRRNNRRILRSLDDRQLADIGISRSEIEALLVNGDARRT